MNRSFLIGCTIFIILLGNVWAELVPPNEARRVALAWLYTCPTFNTDSYIPSSEILDIKDQNHNQTIAYVLRLQPRGFIIVTADDEYNPIIAYSKNSNFDFTETSDNILLILLRRDIADRKQALENNIIDPDYRQKAHSDWDRFRKMVDEQGNSYQIDRLKKVAYTNEWGPWLSSQWGQSSAGGYNVWNIYTPNNYVCGCVATACSQILHYYEWPIAGTGSHSYTWDNGSDPSEVLSADFEATTYDWTNMLDSYSSSATDSERQAAGLLAYHCGIAVNMNYGPGGSGASTSRVATALKDYFRTSGEYVANGVEFYDRLDDNMMNGRPGELSIRDTEEDAGHAIVVDGLGYDDPATKYYHLNMGWRGTGDAWYELPGTISAGGYNFDTINGAVLDIVPSPALTDPGTTTTNRTLSVSWQVSDNVNADYYELQEAMIANTTGSFADDVEGGTGNWTIDGYWEPSMYYSSSPIYSFHGDLYNGSAWNYPGTCTLNKVVKIGTSTAITYYYWLRYFTNYEARLEIADNGSNWTALKTYTSSVDVGPISETVSFLDLAAYEGKTVSLRFVIDYLGGTISYGTGGFYFDDFTIANGGIADWTTVDNTIISTSQPVTFNQSGDYCYRVHANWNSQWWDWSNSESISVELLALDITIFLEGPYNSSSMYTDLTADLPTAHPYGDEPWNHSGSESVGSIPAGVVDWILIELRTGTAASTKVTSRAAFLKNDGSIVDTDGSSEMLLSAAAGDYYVVIYHRNHLAVMSSTALPLNTETTTYDFSSGLEQYYGGEAKLLDSSPSNVYGMYAGDTDASGTINANDRAATWNNRNTTGYLASDCGLTGTCNANDRAATWNNRNKSSKVPSG